MNDFKIVSMQLRVSSSQSSGTVGLALFSCYLKGRKEITKYQ